MSIEQVHLLDKIELTTQPLKAGINKDIQMDYQISLFFDFIEDETKTGQANITDNYVETNYAVQDHIALAPKTYRVKGYVGEIVYQRPSNYEVQAHEEFSKIVNELRTKNKLEQIYSKGSALFPIVASYTNTAINVVNQLKDSFEKYQKILTTQRNQIFNTPTGAKKDLEGIRQNTCGNILFHIMDNRVPLSIKGLQFERTKGKEYDSQYFIQSVQAHQGDSTYKSDFEVTLKEFRTVASKTTNIDEKAINEVNAIQTTNVANNGNATQQTIPKQYMSNWEDNQRIEYLSNQAKELSKKDFIRDFTATVKQFYNDNFVTDRNNDIAKAITIR